MSPPANLLGRGQPASRDRVDILVKIQPALCRSTGSISRTLSLAGTVTLTPVAESREIFRDEARELRRISYSIIFPSRVNRGKAITCFMIRV